MATAPAVLALAVALDLLLGDPPGWPHPVRLMGALITRWERATRRVSTRPGWLRASGVCMAVALPLLAWGATGGLLALAERVSPWLAFSVSVYLAYTCLSLAGLGRMVRQVGVSLAAGDLPGARARVAHIVGRDTAQLDVPGVAAAAVESAAENASDGFVAPLLFLALGGPALGLAYKAVNTADSMVGYRNERYRDFGWGPARLDDVANWVPARLTCLLLGAAAGLVGRNPLRALATAWRDARRHASPNAGWPEAAVAGALGVALGGEAHYGGQRHARPVLGSGEAPGAAHVAQAVRLLWIAGGLAAVLAIAVRGVL